MRRVIPFFTLLDRQYTGIRNIIEYACCVCPSDVATSKDVRSRLDKERVKAPFVANFESKIIPIADLERNEIIKALKQFSGAKDGKLKTALALGLSLATLYRKIKQYQLDE